MLQFLTSLQFSNTNQNIKSILQKQQIKVTVATNKIFMNSSSNEASNFIDVRAPTKDQIQGLAQLICQQYTKINGQFNENISFVQMLETIFAYNEEQNQIIAQEVFKSFTKQLKDHYHGLGLHNIDEDGKYYLTLSRYLDERNLNIQKRVVLGNKYNTLLALYTENKEKLTQKQDELKSRQQEIEAISKINVQLKNQVKELTDSNDQLRNKNQKLTKQLLKDQAQFKNVKQIFQNFKTNISEMNKLYKNQIQQFQRITMEMTKKIHNLLQENHKQKYKLLQAQRDKLQRWVQCLVFDLAEYVSLKKTEDMNCQDWIQKYSRIRNDQPKKNGNQKVSVVRPMRIQSSYEEKYQKLKNDLNRRRY